MIAYQANISVIIPLYNKKSHIIETIDSILTQTHRAAEIIVVNDGSTDGSEQLLLRERGKYIRLINQNNAGVSVARNTGIKAARSPYLAFIDADDLWEPHFLQEVSMLIRQFPAADCYTTAYQRKISDVEYQDPKIRWQQTRPTRPCLLNDYFAVAAAGDLPFSMSSFAVRRSIFNDLGYFPVGEPMGEDQDLFARVAINRKIAYSPRVLSFYQMNTENRACINNVPNVECPFSVRLKTQVDENMFAPHLREAILDYTAAHLLHLASVNIKAHNFEAAKKLLRDKRCKRNFYRYYWWKLKMLTERWKTGVSGHLSTS